MLKDMRLTSCYLLLAFLLTSCSYNPFSTNNHTTGNILGAGIGAGAGAGTVALLGGSKPLMVLGGIGGGMLGYYVTTLRFDAGGVIQNGGQVYQVGQTLGIYIPTDQLFEPNTAEFLPQAPAILNSAAIVLQRMPDNNIIISGNTSGFGRARWERKLSEQRAQKVAAFLWDAGLNQFKEPGIDTRKLTYVGYGDYFPIASDLNNKGIRKNSRIQITSYPSKNDLHLDKRHVSMRNIGSFDDAKAINDAPPADPCGGTTSDCGNSLFK